MTELEQLKAENKHLSDLLNQALKEVDELQELIERIGQCVDMTHLNNTNKN